MAKLKLTSEIVDNVTKVWYAWNELESVCSDDVVNFISSIPEDDNEITITINCCGGNVFEGWRMYDALRQSGKKISCVIECMCASMATVILLAAPKERRYAYEHAQLLIHNPEAAYLPLDYYQRNTADNLDATADKIKLQADALRVEQQKILDLYVDRTGANAEELQTLMNEDIVVDMARAKELGFVSDTLAPNTASFKFNTIMSKKKVEVGQNWLDRLIAKAGFKSADDVKFNDLSFTAANGESFSVEREEGNYAVGDNASPDGSFVMEDGSTVVITDGVISDVIAPAAVLKNPATDEEISEEEAQALLNDYYSKIQQLEEDICEREKKKDEADAKLETANNDINALNEKVSALDATVADLSAKVVTDEQTAILDFVANAGGMEWLNNMKTMQSNGSPRVPQATMGENKPTFGASFAADYAKSNKRFRVNK